MALSLLSLPPLLAPLHQTLLLLLQRVHSYAEKEVGNFGTLLLLAARPVSLHATW